MSMYNLIEYSDNYSDTSGSLWQFKRDKDLTQAFSGEACDRMRTRPHTRKSV